MDNGRRDSRAQPSSRRSGSSQCERMSRHWGIGRRTCLRSFSSCSCSWRRAYSATKSRCLASAHISQGLVSRLTLVCLFLLAVSPTCVKTPRKHPYTRITHLNELSTPVEYARGTAATAAMRRGATVRATAILEIMVEVNQAVTVGKREDREVFMAGQGRFGWRRVDRDEASLGFPRCPSAYNLSFVVDNVLRRSQAGCPLRASCYFL